MLSSFFSKSKPINYIAVALYMGILFGIAHYRKGFEAESSHILLTAASIFLYILPMLALNFVAQKNDLTNKGTFTILLYAFLTAILPNSLTSFPILLSNVFVLLAVQNILHLRNEKHIKAKIFNASIFIGLASLAYFWSIGFIILVFLGILFFDPKNYRNWIIPFIGVSMIYVFANCFTLLFYDSFFAIATYIDSISFSFQTYFIKEHLFSVGIISICIVFFFSIYLIKFGRKTANTKPILRVVIIYLIVAIVVAAIAPEKDTSELFFIATPLSLIGTTYLEMNYHQFAKEINIWVFILIPFTILLF
ncbi:DUF6427 family protein [Aquimarina macrocephali]|uniref:DUF6427 family protein n=1 Tax=Aquimarina macrocephali TaxID=666563 RepID=UPI000463930A|nr:DUF6427 family protein [Aquimarina macrocephali]